MLKVLGESRPITPLNTPDVTTNIASAFSFTKVGSKGSPSGGSESSNSARSGGSSGGRGSRSGSVADTARVGEGVGHNGYCSTDVPASEDDRQALLEWAYFEATTLLRQYGDLLEEVQLYMDTGASTVGECAEMIDEQLIRS